MYSLQHSELRSPQAALAGLSPRERKAIHLRMFGLISRRALRRSTNLPQSHANPCTVLPLLPALSVGLSFRNVSSKRLHCRLPSNRYSRVSTITQNQKRARHKRSQQKGGECEPKVDDAACRKKVQCRDISNI